MALFANKANHSAATEYQKALALAYDSTLDISDLSEDAEQSGFFERVESKFIAPAMYRDLFEAYAATHLAPCYPDPKTQFVDIESLYFDSRSLKFFEHHMLGLPLRAKVRLRRYAPDGIFNPQSLAYIEVKTKKEGVCKKFRIALSAEAEEQILKLSTLSVSESLRQVNPELDEKSLGKRVKKIAKVLRKHQLVPVMQVRYRRRSFEKDGLRMTIDSNIQSRNLSRFYPQIAEYLTKKYSSSILESNHFRFSNEANCIAEIKHSGVIPAWALDLTRAIGIQEVKFSKYCWSIIKRGQRGLPDFLNNNIAPIAHREGVKQS